MERRYLLCRVAVYALSRPLTVERRASISNQTPLCPTNSGMSTQASQKGEGEGGTCTGVRVVERRNGPLMSPVQASYTRGYRRDLYRELPTPKLAEFQHTEERRLVDHGERACNTTGQSECAQVRICSLLTSRGAIWSRSSDGPFWNFEGEHQKQRGRDHSRRGIGIDKCHAALISLSVSPPACPAQSDTHVWCWSAGAYPNMDFDTRSVEKDCAFDQERSWDRALNGS